MAAPRLDLQGLTRSRVAVIAAVVLALVGLAAVILQLSAPVQRTGNPTLAVPMQTPASPRPPVVSSTPSASASASTQKPSVSPSTPKSTMKASDKFAYSSLTQRPAGSQGDEHSFVVAVETTAKLSANDVAGVVAQVANDPRSWTGDGSVRFSLIKNVKQADFTFYLASGTTVAELCGSSSESAWTCSAGGKVVINAERWKKAAPSYGRDLTGYRRFLVNHVLGHYLGERHAKCSKSNAKAPVMLQQSEGLGGCLANPWPH